MPMGRAVTAPSSHIARIITCTMYTVHDKDDDGDDDYYDDD